MSLNLSIISVALCTLAGVCLDLLLGEAKRWHPLMGFGTMAIWIEKKLNGGRFALRFVVFAWMLAILPAVLLAYALLGNTLQALNCWRTQTSLWPSPNAVPVMVAGVGTLNLAPGKAATCEGEVENRPALEKGRPAAARDIGHAWPLILHSTKLWLTVLVTTAVIFQLRMFYA